MNEPLQHAFHKKLAKMAEADQGHLPWLTYWLLVIRDEPFGAGMAGFKGFPNQNGEAEIGYGIDPAFQGQGYMTEAVKAMIAWAFEEKACRAVVARTAKKGNMASMRVLQKVGMVVYQETDTTLDFRIER